SEKRPRSCSDPMMPSRAPQLWLLPTATEHRASRTQKFQIWAEICSSEFLISIAGDANSADPMPQVDGAVRRHSPFRIHELLAKPSILEAPAVEKAVDHNRDPVHRRRPAGPQPVVKDHRARSVLSQPAVDRPDQLLTFCLVGLHRLLLVHLLQLRIAVVGVVA